MSVCVRLAVMRRSKGRAALFRTICVRVYELDRGSGESLIVRSLCCKADESDRSVVIYLGLEAKWSCGASKVYIFLGT